MLGSLRVPLCSKSESGPYGKHAPQQSKTDRNNQTLNQLTPVSVGQQNSFSRQEYPAQLAGYIPCRKPSRVTALRPINTIHITGRIALSQFLLSLLLPFVMAFASAPATPPAVGEKAPDFTLVSQQGKRVQLSALTAKAPVVLVVLRGYPGYQCPLCNQQVHDFLKNAQGFADAKVQVVLIYPGPPDNNLPDNNLAARAKEFTADKSLPENFTLLLDPGYEFTNLYGLRWDAPKETAYPSTFLLDQKGIVFFAKVSKTHGGRTKAAEILDVLAKK